MAFVTKPVTNEINDLEMLRNRYSNAVGCEAIMVSEFVKLFIDFDDFSLSQEILIFNEKKGG